MKRYYVGIFPPKYGGVTIKNNNLYKCLTKYLDIQRIDLNEVKRYNLKELLRLIFALLGNNQLIIGVAGQRRQLCKLLYYINRNAMRKSIIFIMGGSAANEIANDKKYYKYMQIFKKIYVETEGMKKTLNIAGLNNVDIYPNGRFRPTASIAPQCNVDEQFKCVFFSLIDKSKGVDIILESANKLQNVEFNFYGEINESFKEYFFDSISKLANVSYHGVFKGKEEKVYFELRKYDVLLLPTKWKAEGVPGILVESKIACIPSIVSDINYNKEIVKDGLDGIVLKKNDSEDLCQAIKTLKNNSNLLLKMRKNCQIYSSNYFIEEYIEKIINEIKL